MMSSGIVLPSGAVMYKGEQVPIRNPPDAFVIYPKAAIVGSSGQGTNDVCRMLNARYWVGSMLASLMTPNE